MNEVVQLVLFLENRKIRQWPIDDREPLKTLSPAWHVAVAKYLVDAKCPLVHAGEPFSDAQLPAYVSWLISYAITLEYEEKGVCFLGRLGSGRVLC